jgi:hypothetical protein
MSRLSFLLIFTTVLMLSMGVTVDAQATCTDPFTGGAIPCPPSDPAQPVAPDAPDADGDGTPDSVDQCPNAGGPAQNVGCPLASDADGDGTPDSADECPNEGGPDWNNGCPTDESAPATTQNLPALPQFPLDPDADAPCLMATLTTTPVNLRERFTVQSPVESILDPYEPEAIYQRHVIIRGGLTEVWYNTLYRGFGAEWVTRISPQCEGNLSRWYWNYTREQMSLVVQDIGLGNYAPDPETVQYSVTLICPDFNTVLLPTDALTDCDGNGVSPAPNGERFLCDDTWVEAYDDCAFSSLPAVLINENARLLNVTLAPPSSLEGADLPPDEEQITLLFGTWSSLSELMFNPQPEPPAEPIEDGIFVLWLVGDVPDVNIVGFNPQPEPPAIDANFGLLIGVNVPDVNIVGFNPQPEPPAIVTNFGNFSLNPTANGYQLINADGVGVEIGLIDPEISPSQLTLLSLQDMPNMTLWSFTDEAGGSTTIACPGSVVSFNPQPEPPALDACFSVNPVG